MEYSLNVRADLLLCWEWDAKDVESAGDDLLRHELRHAGMGILAGQLHACHFLAQGS
ncbi:hypothetical protein ACIGO6_40160 [Streptomyces sp. NPDC053750]|uniref:hypothetical protein n=1 Tax=Streptomyces sp. NPDC053750 TaxID=3365714 RepID=UPI0037CEA051